MFKRNETMLLEVVHPFYAEEVGEGQNMKTILGVSGSLAVNRIIQVN